MAELVSPGVSISVSDESFYASAGTGTVPLIVIATAQDKASPDGAGVAPGTTAAQAGRLRLVTSQRDLLTTYGNPVFRTSGSTPLHGHELNEYGLLAAQSFLGIANRAFVLRADLDLSELEASTTAPTGDVAEGTYWLNLGSTNIGLKRWDGTAWIAITEVSVPAPHETELSGNIQRPKTSFGKDGDIAFLAFQNGGLTFVNETRLYEKVAGEWYHIGTSDWQTATTGDFQVARSTNLPTSRSTGVNLVIGDLVWQMNEANQGNFWGFNIYENGQWVRVSSEGYAHSFQVYDFYESQGGPVAGDLWKDFDTETATLFIKRHNGQRVLNVRATTVPENISAPASNTGQIAFEIVANNRDIVNGNSGIIGVTFEGFDADADGNATLPEQTFVITTVANPDTQVGGAIYQVDGVNNPVLNLVRGGVYTFDQSDASNDNHPIAFRDSSGASYTTGVVSTGTPGTAGAQTVFTVPANAPSDLRYYCTVHGNGMGNTINMTDPEINGNGNLSVDEIVSAISSALSSANASLTEADKIGVFIDTSGRINFRHTGGRDIELRTGDVDILDLGFADPDNELVARSTPYSNWIEQPYRAQVSIPTGDLANGSLWYDTRISNDSIDLLWNDPVDGWVTYPFDINVAASTPQTQSDGTELEANDVWIDSSDLENYPQVYRWTGSVWSLLDNSDQDSTAGIVFADVRSSTGSLDPDAPNPVLFPFFMIVWNKRLSGGNVKQWDADATGAWGYGYWEDYSGNKSDGSPYMLRKAQRRAVVRQLQSVIASNQDIRNESNSFNLMAVPGYPELLDEMITLNTDRKETAFIIADAPLRLSADASSLQNWATNSSNAIENGEDGLVSSSSYAAVYYPHGLTTNLDGNNVVVPASHIALRTFAFNDQVAFPWFAPAGFQRGVVTNATSVGFIDAQSGEFRAVALSEGQRDSLYINKVNPVAQFPGRGLSIFGQKTLNPVSSALDRVNVARLVVFIRERLDDLVKPFLFEPNDEITRQNAKVLVDRFLGNLVTQRGLFDFVVVCDSSNNTPERIDRNELHIDIAIQPVKAVEFIYIPIRVQNTLGQSN